MYGNTTLPGITPGKTARNEGTIWRGYTESTWFKAVTVKSDGDEAVKVPLGTVLKEIPGEGTYTPMAESDIITEVASLPGPRLAIVADSTGKAQPEGSETSILIGVMGQVDQARLTVGGKVFEELTEEQQRCLRTQLEAWGLQPVPLTQA